MLLPVLLLAPFVHCLREASCAEDLGEPELRRLQDVVRKPSHATYGVPSWRGRHARLH
jgi:hypothetical protein